MQLAIDAGHVESTCLRNRNWLGLKDWQLMEHDLTNRMLESTPNEDGDLTVDVCDEAL